jgi:predicted RNA binding protein YcfA (HicA-like mRNA interferase family)
MSKFPVDASIRKVVKALQRLGFNIVREGNHIAMLRENSEEQNSGYTSI